MTERPFAALAPTFGRTVGPVLGLTLAGLLATTAAASAAPVTYQRLVHPEDANWLTYSRTYDSHRYSPLAEINTGNVGTLRLAFALPLKPEIPGVRGGGLQGTPLVADGIMYMVDGVGVVYRIDVSSGKAGYINWMMDPQSAPETIGLGNNKAVSLLGDNVYSVSNEGDLIATDAASGEVLWQVATKIDPDDDFTMGTLALDGKIILGPKGGGAGINRGWLEARSATDGAQLWHFWAVPAPGEPGGETWPAGEAYKIGGSGYYAIGSYDPDNNLVLYGTTEPDPAYDPSTRAGDNLYSASTVALDGNTGALKWYFQYTPQDQFDYDAIGTPMILDYKGVREIGHFQRNGFLYILNEADGAFIKATQYIDQVNWTAGIDPKTGKPVEYDPALAVGGIQKYAVAPLIAKNPPPLLCPNVQGGNNHWPTSYSERTQLMYATSIEGCAVAGDPRSKTTGSVASASGDGTIVKRVPIPFAPYGGQMTTAGGLMFSSMSDGQFFAMDDTSLQTLWSVNLGSPIEAPPISYAVNGKQYVAIPVATSMIVGQTYPRRGDDPNAASLANIQRTWMMYFFTL